MPFLRAILVFALLAFGTLFLAAPAAQAADQCAAAVPALNAAIAAGDLRQASTIYTAQIRDAGCSDSRLVYCDGQILALRYLDAAVQAYSAGGSPETLAAALGEAKSLGQPYQLLATLGDMALQRAQADKDPAGFKQAAQYYQDALNTLNDDRLPGDDASMACETYGGPSLPPQADIAAISQRMDEALLLAPHFELTRTRDGACGGVFLETIRGFTPEARPLPISFDFDKTSFTPEGAKMAATLLACVLERHYTSVTLSGHTDAKGTDAYNMDLSKRRLDAVVAYLRQGGFAGKLLLVPMGERAPFPVSDPSVYSQDEIDQLNRRVSLGDTEPKAQP